MTAFDINPHSVNTIRKLKHYRDQNVVFPYIYLFDKEKIDKFQGKNLKISGRNSLIKASRIKGIPDSYCYCIAILNSKSKMYTIIKTFDQYMRPIWYAYIIHTALNELKNILFRDRNGVYFVAPGLHSTIISIPI